MALTKEDLQAIRLLIKEENAPIVARLDTVQEDVGHLKTDMSKLQKDNVKIVDRLDAMQEDIEEIKEDVAVTLEMTNALGEWTEIASGALKITYPIPAKE